MKNPSTGKRFAWCCAGSALIEFAFITPILFTLILGVIEFGLIAFATSAIESATATVARQARVRNDLGSGDLVRTIRQEIQRRSNGLVENDATLITTDIDSDFEDLRKPDICRAEPPAPPGTCPPGAPFEERNGIPGFQADTFPPLALGGPNDLITLRVLYRWRVLTPLAGPIIGDDNGDLIISTITFIKNEP